jgi:hypothetical protein
MNSSGRGTTVVLGIVGVVAGIVALSGEGGPLVGLAAVGGFIALLAAVFANTRLRQLQERLPQFAATVKATPAARAATARARRIANYAPSEMITDIALIVNDRDRNGRLSRRIAQNVSMDDYAVQPVVKFTAPPEDLHRVAIVKFEIIDKSGKLMFSRQVEHYTRDGENLVSCDQQLPFSGNTKLGRAGIWDLQVTINGQLAAVHSFNVTPSQQFNPVPVDRDGELATLDRLSAPEEDSSMPLTLEDLLREQQDDNTGYSASSGSAGGGQRRR